MSRGHGITRRLDWDSFFPSAGWPGIALSCSSVRRRARHPSEGIALLPEHRSTTVVMRFDPVRDADGSLRVDHLLPDTPEGLAIAASVRSGATTGLSVEFFTAWTKRGCKASARFVNRW